MSLEIKEISKNKNIDDPKTEDPHDVGRSKIEQVMESPMSFRDPVKLENSDVKNKKIKSNEAISTQFVLGFACKECGLQFTKKSNLNRHISCLSIKESNIHVNIVPTKLLNYAISKNITMLFIMVLPKKQCSP